MKNSSVKEKNFSQINKNDQENIFSDDLKIETTPKRNMLNSFNVSKTLKHIRFLHKREWHFLENLIQCFPFVDGEYQLDAWVVSTNATMAYSMHCCSDTARIAKEGLQARSIILVDGKPWSLEKPFTMASQTIQFNPAFISWFKDCVKSRKILPYSRWQYCQEYADKMEAKKIRYKINKAIRNGGNLCISLFKNGVEALRKSRGGGVDFFNPFINQENNLDNESSKERKPNPFEIKKPLNEVVRANRILSTMVDLNQKKPETKQWTENTNEFCINLIKSGMTKFETAKKMIKLGYVKTIEEFEMHFDPVPKPIQN